MAEIVDEAKQTRFRMSVHQVIDLAFRIGDLRGVSGGRSLKRAQQGSEGHRRIQSSRSSDYLKEIPLSWTLESGDYALTIHGRVDGLIPRPGGWRVEEIKTTWSSWDGNPSLNHWAQARLYGFFLCERDGLDHIELQLTYLELDTDQISVFREDWTLDQLRDYAMPGLEYALMRWINRAEWIETRNASLEEISFPFSQYRPGQRQLAVAVYRTVRDGGILCAEAPTGIGKTISTLFPTLKAMGAGQMDSISFLTAKNTGRQIAEESLDRLRAQGARVRSLHWTAKSRLCFCSNGMDLASGDKVECKVLPGEACPFTLGYFDRIRGALDEILELEKIDAASARAVGFKHQVCPHAMIQEVARWSDVRIGDYNYRFDPLVAPSEEMGSFGIGKEVLLIDEAHHFPDRAREMYSAELNLADLKRARAALKDDASLKGPTGLILKMEKELQRLASDGWEEARPGRATGMAQGWVSQALPSKLLKAVRKWNQSFEDRWTDDLDPGRVEVVFNLFFSSWSWERCADRWSDNYAAILDGQSSDSSANWLRMRLACLDPSDVIRERLEAVESVVFFSGTMGSSRYRHFEKQVGLNSDPTQPAIVADVETETENETKSVIKAAESLVSPPELSKQSLKCQWIVAESPFPRENFLAIEAPYVSTIYSQRESSAASIVESVYQAISVKQGHYWVFFSSFEYLEQIYELFIAKYPQVNCLRQQPGMSDEERERFLNYFKREDTRAENTESRLGMVTLGGIFGEGVDLVGESLIGAIIVGVGLPMLDLERNLIRDLGDQRGEDGFETAYVYPGMQRVAQAAGRVIRTAEDRGFVVLLDYRYRQSRFHKSLPAYWRRSIAPTTGKLTELIKEFWTARDG